MAQIMPAGLLRKMADEEIALLLLAAYLHDIGMTPEVGHVRKFYAFILAGDSTGLTEGEKSELTNWVSDQHPEINLPLVVDRQVTTEDLRSAEYLCAHFCRWKHNDWSEAWIRRHLSSVSWKGYSEWLPDLITLCRSHHESYGELKSDRFLPRVVSSREKAVVHLRYLACVLRIADILEFDPERTPEIVMKHRDVSKESAIYWYKDHSVHLAFNLRDKQILLGATPKNASMHKAILCMADEIDAELLLCKRLSDETHFEKYPGPLPDLPHSWILPYVVHRQIVPLPGAYEYIDGSFRPNTKRLLHLLSGTELYGNPLAAIRELLQNAFDATKEQMAREWLGKAGATPDMVQIMEQLNTIDLRIEQNDGRLYLTCTDGGIGMSKRIIEQYLLVSGSDRRRELRDLEYRCDIAGYGLTLTGQFGIGVLSYFMIADRVELRTRRSMFCDDADGSGWLFETEGVGTFGELKKAQDLPFGTSVRLRLLPNVASSEESFSHDLLSFVSSSLAFLPCKVTISNGTKGLIRVLSPGWTLEVDHFVEVLKGQVRVGRNRQRMDLPDEALTSKRREARQAEALHEKTVKDEMAKHVKWAVSEGELPGKLGRYRIHIPYFEIAGGISIGFMRTTALANNALRVARIGTGTYFLPQGHFYHSWRGMYAEAYGGSLSANRAFVEVDWTSKKVGIISVSRNTLQFNDQVQPAIDWLRKKSQMMLDEALQKNNRPSFLTTNARLAANSTPTGQPIFWIKGNLEDKDHVALAEIEFPATTRMPYSYSRVPSELKWNDIRISITDCMTEPDAFVPFHGITFNSLVSPDRIVLAPHYKFTLAPLWVTRPNQRIRNRSMHTAEFSPEWPELVGTYFHNFSGKDQGGFVWNKDHQIIKAMSDSSWDKIHNTIREQWSPMTLEGGFVNSQESAVIWFVKMLSRRNEEIWNGLVEHQPQFAHAIWSAVLGGKEARVLLWVEAGTDSYLLVFSSTNCTRYEQPGELLPAPGALWELRAV